MDEQDRKVSIPFTRNRWGHVSLPESMTAADWQYMHDVLEAMRPGLVVEPLSSAELSRGTLPPPSPTTRDVDTPAYADLAGWKPEVPKPADPE